MRGAGSDPSMRAANLPGPTGGNRGEEVFRVSLKKVGFRNFQHSGPGPEYWPFWAFWANLFFLGLLGHFRPFLVFWTILGLLGPFWAI